MTSTKKTAATCVYLELDITDRYADSRRAMDVCGLEIRDHTLTPHFWTWSWGPTDLIDLTDLLPEISAAKAVMLDGPQGLARVGCNIRASERSLAAAGKTGDKRPPLSQPYGGFVASSLDLFAAFHAAGLFDPSTQDLQLDEVYPASIWTRLARGLPNKRRGDGRQARVAILRTLGVAVPDAPSHDDLDARAAALLAAAADRHIQGLRVAAVGDPMYWDDDAACLREGQTLIPEVDAPIFTKLQSVVAPRIASPEKQTLRAVRSASMAQRGAGELSIVARPSLDGATREDRAAQLFELAGV